MIASMIALMLTSFSFATAQSTIEKDCQNFKPCLNDGEIYKTATCDPLQSKNATWYSTCLCLNNINIGYCYKQCTSDPESVKQGLAFEATITSSCAAVGINPKGPLPLAPWVQSPTVTSTTVAPTSSSGSSPVATVSATAPQNNGQKIMSSLAGLILVFLA